MNENFRIIGAEKLKKVLENCVNSSNEFIAIVTDTTSDIMNDSQKNLNPHYKTGGLSKSGSFNIKGLNGEVGYSVKYAPHVEYGHRTRGGGFVAGVKYLHNAVENNRDAHQKAVSDLVKKLTGN
ncbi:MAG: hypothetical protein FD141_359 [Fusobacteria bacterium]|nr:MAG: hypothetical protein FD141_359 [Fusobacteriota bacterium]KAF0228976.1 MAG: hypothetical protein FD182_1232 [Fusobacteriota bacterium]